MSKKKAGKTSKKPLHLKAGEAKKLRPVTVVLIVIAALAVAVGIAALIILSHLYSKMNYDTGMNQEELSQAIEEFKQNEELTKEENDDDSDAEELSQENIEAAQNTIRQDIEKNATDLLSDKAVWNIMLIGSDARTTGSNARSDAMILLSVNKNTKQIVMTSFMRDIYTYIPDAGFYNRLNVPNAVGGPTFLTNTIESVFGVEIDNYAYVNFYSFVDAVDAVGGVDIDVDEGEIYEINNNLIEQNSMLGQSNSADKLSYSNTGLIHLNGNQALAYSRIRHIGGDQQRTERQREVITALIEKAKTLSLTELYNLVDIILPMITTDLTQNDCLSLALKAMDYMDYEIISQRIPADGDYYMTSVDGMSVVMIDFAAAKELLQETIYGVSEKP